MVSYTLHLKLKTQYLQGPMCSTLSNTHRTLRTECSDAHTQPFTRQSQIASSIGLWKSPLHSGVTETQFWLITTENSRQLFTLGWSRSWIKLHLNWDEKSSIAMQNPDFVLSWAVSKIVYKPPASKQHRSHTDETHVWAPACARPGDVAALGPPGSMIFLQLTAALTLSLHNPIF